MRTTIYCFNLRSKIAREAARKAREDARKGTSKKREERSLSGKLVEGQQKVYHLLLKVSYNDRKSIKY